jgi:hypothetical protein
VDGQLAVSQSSAKVGHELESPDDVIVHRRGVDDVLGLATRLRSIHGDVGAAQQLVGVSTDCDADARGDEHLSPVDFERRLERGGDSLGRIEGRSRGIGLFDQDRELVAAHARDRVGRRERRAQALADRLQQLVAGEVSQTVVDRLEVVEIEEQHGRVSGAHDECMLDAIREQGSIREACQRVVERLMAELLLGLTPVGDVEEVSPV